MIDHLPRRIILFTGALVVLALAGCYPAPEPTLELDLELTLVDTADPTQPLTLEPSQTPAPTPSNTPWPTDTPRPSRTPPSTPTFTPPPDLVIGAALESDFPDIWTSLVFVREEEGRLALFSWEGGESAPRRLVRNQKDLISPDWSPDGRQLAYLATENYQFYQDGASLHTSIKAAATDLYLYLAGVDVPLGPTGDMYIFDIAWSPDSSRIAFTGRELDEEGFIIGGQNIYQISILTQNRKPVIETDRFNVGCSSPAWAPDSAHLLARCRAMMGMGLVFSDISGADTWSIDTVADRVVWKPDSDQVVVINGWYPLEIFQADYLYQKGEGVDWEIRDLYQELEDLGVQSKSDPYLAWAPHHPDRFVIQASDLIQIVDTGLGKVLSLGGDFTGLEGQFSWGPAGDQLAVVYDDGADAEIGVIDFSAGTFYALTANDVDDLMPAWQPALAGE